jgi:integrase
LQERGFEVPIKLTDLKATMITARIYFLTEEEVKILENFEFSEDRLTRVRDVFVFNCYTGLRISDLSRLRSHHIVDDVIELRSHKNQKDIYSPLTSKSKKILEKYSYELPIISEQKFNKYIKEACMKASIDQPVEIIKKSSGNKSYSIMPKWSIVSSHTAIKTFISLCGAKGISAKIVAEITGKSVEVILKHYYGVDKKTIKDQMRTSFG